MPLGVPSTTYRIAQGGAHGRARDDQGRFRAVQHCRDLLSLDRRCADSREHPHRLAVFLGPGADESAGLPGPQVDWGHRATPERAAPIVVRGEHVAALSRDDAKVGEASLENRRTELLARHAGAAAHRLGYRVDVRHHGSHYTLWRRAL